LAGGLQLQATGTTRSVAGAQSEKEPSRLLRIWPPDARKDAVPPARACGAPHHVAVETKATMRPLERASAAGGDERGW